MLQIKKIILVFFVLGIIIITGCSREGSTVEAPINQDFDSDEKLLVVEDSFDVTLIISARDDYLQENVIVSSLYDKIQGRYTSASDGNILNFEDYFEIVSISGGWDREKITTESDYEIVNYMVEYSGQSEILDEGWLFLNDEPSTESKTLTISLKTKQKGSFGLVMSQMQSKTGYINICVGDDLEEAKELCIEKERTSTREETIETEKIEKIEITKCGELYHFFFEGCLHCPAQEIEINNLIIDESCFNIKKIDINKETDFVEKYNVRAVPAVVFIDEAGCFKKSEGLKTALDLADWINNVETECELEDKATLQPTLNETRGPPIRNEPNESLLENET